MCEIAVDTSESGPSKRTRCESNEISQLRSQMLDLSLKVDTEKSRCEHT